MAQVNYIYNEFKKSSVLLLKNRKTYISARLLLPVLIVLAGVISSCSSTKYVPSDKYLLNKYQIKTDSRKINTDDLTSYIKQKPNKKVLGFRFHLSVYNLSRENKNNWWNRRLRTIGEEPVILDEFQTGKTAGQLQLYLENKGYFKAEVNDTILYNKKKANVIYNISVNEPYLIRNIKYRFEDPDLEKYIIPDTAFCLIKRGDNFDSDVLSSERLRMETDLRNKGFFSFSENYIFFQPDSFRLGHKVDITIVVKKYMQYLGDGSYTTISHPRYKIGKVAIITNYNAREALTKGDSYFLTLDTLLIDSIYLVYEKVLNVKPSIVLSSNYIIPGETYNLNNSNQTYRNLSSLQLFRQVTIEFNEPSNQDELSVREINCSIQLSPFILQSLTTELEATNSSGNIGGGGNITYQHRNLFHGAENFNLQFKGAVETLKQNSADNFGNMIELGSEAALIFPKFLLPFRTEQFIKKFNPKTTLKLAYNFQRRPDYSRTVANASFGYVWKGNPFLTHVINPIELNIVKIPYKSDDFVDWLNEHPYILYSYQPHLVSVTNYSMTFTNQNLQKTKDFIYFKLNAESAGNILYSVFKTSGASKNNGVYELFNTEFAQYLRGDVDFRHYNILNSYNSIVYRLYAGAGLPYKNSSALPFEKKFFSGGANSIRAWQVRDLGPGSYVELIKGPYSNQMADIKLEANLEYRFKLFWVLEGALFVDAGNIWAINKNDDRAGALFEINKFYKDIAVGTGFGTRFDFTFFIFRFDLGIKTRNPIYPVGEKWVFGNRKLERGDFVLNLGIGYPF